MEKVYNNRDNPCQNKFLFHYLQNKLENVVYVKVKNDGVNSMVWSKGNINATDEKIILISIIGIINSIKNKAITLEEAEKFLFSPHTRSIMQSKRCDSNIIALIDYGCELEDIKSIMPSKFTHTLNDIEQKALTLLSKYEKSETDFWIDE